jgi:hypothetical protein
MRKRLKRKRHSCPMCKPHKMGITNRWKSKEFMEMMKDMEEISEYLKSGKGLDDTESENG